MVFVYILRFVISDRFIFYLLLTVFLCCDLPSAVINHLRCRAMAVCISSESMQEIFTLAAGDGNDALIVKPGVAGMSVLLQAHFFRLSDYG